MKGFVTALSLAALLGVAGSAGAVTSVIDFNDASKTKDVKALGTTTTVREADIGAVKTSGTDGTEGFLALDVTNDLFKDSKALWVRVDYFDQGTDSFQLEYDTADDPVAVANP